MKTLQDCIQNHAVIFVVINILELGAGLLLCLIPLKKAWQEYLVCVYGGFLFGMIPVFYLSESISCMLVCSVILAVMLCWIQYFYSCEGKVSMASQRNCGVFDWKKLYLPLLILYMKITLIAEGIFLYETDYEWSVGIFILAMALALMAYVFTNFVIDPAAIQSHFILAFFGVTEVVGAVLQFYRMDYSVFQKELQDKEGTLGFFLYILKVDYSYFDTEDLFVIGLLMALIGYFAWKKIFDGLRGICQKRMVGVRKDYR